MHKYCVRKWLNDDDSASTGSAVAYHGEITWKDKPELTSYLEVADCHNKIRLHRAYDDTPAMFIEKLDILQMMIRNFSSYLKIIDDPDLVPLKAAMPPDLFERRIQLLLSTHERTPFTTKVGIIAWWHATASSFTSAHYINAIARHILS